MGPPLSGVSIVQDREITNRQGEKAWFVAFEGTSGAGRSSMVRAVFFRREERAVGLVLAIDSTRYTGQMERYWLDAVNTFKQHTYGRP